MKRIVFQSTKLEKMEPPKETIQTNNRSFGIDKNVGGQPRTVANTITAREDRGVSNQKQTGTAVAIPIGKL